VLANIHAFKNNTGVGAAINFKWEVLESKKSTTPPKSAYNNGESQKLLITGYALQFTSSTPFYCSVCASIVIESKLTTSAEKSDLCMEPLLNFLVPHF